MGNGRLRELPPVAPDVVVLGVVSPAESARLIASSKLVVTTPGIGAVYEALMHGTVVVLLVPKKRTQLHHYKVLTGLGIAGAVPPRLMTRLAAAAANVDWARQTLRCLRVLKDFPEPILSQLMAIGQPLLQASVDSAVRERYLGMQGKLLRMLSQADPVGVLRTLVLP